MGLLIEFALILFVLYLIDRYFRNVWLRRGFPQLKSTFLVGNIGPILSVKESVHDLFNKYYLRNKHTRFVGYYEFYRPSLLITDTELAHSIMIKDFNNFHDHNPPFDLEFDPMIGNLFAITGQKWRDLRVSLSPTFTSGKLKKMFPHVEKCAISMADFIKKNLSNGEYNCDFKDLFSRFNINIIASVAFGIENDCINDRDHSFYIKSQEFFAPKPRNLIRNFFFSFFPQGMKLFKIKFAPKSVEDFFLNLVREIIQYRESNKTIRNDFMDLLIKLKNQGYIPADDDNDDEEEDKSKNIDGKMRKLTFNEVAAQAFVFFLAAFETTSSAATFCLFELAKNPKIQEKVHKEIDKVISKQEITYDAIKSLKYLECCVLESLRKYAAVPLLSRYCTADYKIPKSDLVIPKGTALQIPAFQMHRDPDIYDNPLEFRPERFLNSPTGNPKVQGLTYFAFGDGPRHCIGMRMAKLNLSLGLTHLLSKFKFELVDEKLYHQEIELDIKQFPTMPNGRLLIKAIAR